jgi:3-deoxy-D-manno-octulosonate 8-phosphate phosphatase (KDO 8-P phosphatase)
MGNFKEEIAKVTTFVFDVDGVFTDGGIMPLPDGDFVRKYYAKDGYAVAYAVKAGYNVFIITGGRGAMLERRFKLLGVTALYTDCEDKVPVFERILEEYGLRREEVLFMGDDIPDLESMKAAGVAVCPADAATEILEAADYVSQYTGGMGCVRDIVEQVLRARGDWAKHFKGVNVVSA